MASHGRWTLLVLLLVAGPVGASGGTNDLHVEGGITVRGTAALLGDLSLSLAGPALVADADEVRKRGLLLEGAQTARLVNAPLEVFVVRGPTGGLVNASRAAAQHVVTQTDVQGIVSFISAGEGPALYRVLGPLGRELTLQVEEANAVHLTAPALLDRRPNGGFLGHAPKVDGQPIGSSAPVMMGQAPGITSWHLEDGYAAVLFDGEFRVGSGAAAPVWKTGRFLNESASTFDPVTGTGRYVYDHLVLLVESPDGRVQTPGGWGLAATRLQGHLDGEAAWAGVDAKLTADGEPLPYDPELLLLRGRLALEANVQGSEVSWFVEGPVEFLAADGVPWIERGPGAALAATTLLALALSLFTDLGRSLLTFVVGSHTPKLLKAKPLGNDLRRQMLRVIHEQQPIRQTDLVTATGASKTTVAYHLRILLAHDLLQTELDRGVGQRNTTFMLNSNSMHFITAGVADFLGATPTAQARTAPNVVASRALAAVNSNPLRRAMFDALREHGPMDFAALRDRLVASGAVEKLPQSSASHHLQQLVTAGALAESRVDRRKIYAANVDPSMVRAEQYRRFLEQEDALELVESLVEGGPATREELRARLVGAGLSDRQAARHCSRARHLAGMHILDVGEDGRYRPAAFLAGIPRNPRGKTDGA